jgi:hypothetical protein
VNVTPIGFGRRIARRAVALLPLAVGGALVAGVALRQMQLPPGGLVVALGGYLVTGLPLRWWRGAASRNRVGGRRPRS